jgi:hypothetical protein
MLDTDGEAEEIPEGVVDLLVSLAGDGDKPIDF